jgi:hypothetical protein
LDTNKKSIQLRNKVEVSAEVSLILVFSAVVATTWFHDICAKPASRSWDPGLPQLAVVLFLVVVVMMMMMI